MERLFKHLSREEFAVRAPQATENYAFETSLFPLLTAVHQVAEISVQLLHEKSLRNQMGFLKYQLNTFPTSQMLVLLSRVFTF